MATYDLRRFSNPEALKAITPRCLLQFLRPFERFFAGRGVPLPGPQDADKLDYKGIVDVLMEPGADTPEELKNALYTVHEMATDEGADVLLDALAEDPNAPKISKDATSADIAVQTFLFDRGLLARKHVEQSMIRQRSFEYYQTKDGKGRALKKPTTAQIAALKSDLDDWFDSKKRGRASQITFYEKGGEVWFLVSHGDRYKRQDSIKGGKSEPIFFRPGMCDVIVYSPRLGEMRIHADPNNAKDIYRAKFGLHLFGDEDLFSGEDKYTLKPLQVDGPKSVVCDDVDGMEWVKLVEVQYHWGGPENDREIRRSDDMFASLERKKRVIPPTATITRASFKVRFSDSKKERSVRIRPSNVALYVRDSDGVIVEDFLTKRGFIKGAEVVVDEEDDWVDDVKYESGAAAVANP